MHIAIPADFMVATVDRIRDFNAARSGDAIFEVYGSLPDSGFAAGRSASSLPRPTRQQFEEYVRWAQSHHIMFNYTLNGSCLGGQEYDVAWRDDLHEFAQYLSSLGITTFTVSTPALVAILHHLLPEASITVSLTADVRTPDVARDYLSLGASTVMASVSLTRRFRDLERLTRTSGVRVGVLLNSFCFPDCAYRHEHFNTSGHITGAAPSLYAAAGSFDFNRCALAKLTDPKQFLRTAWIRPEDVSRYEAVGVDFFKLEGRQREGFDAVRAAAVYCEREYHGNLCSLHALFATCTLDTIISIDNRNLDGFIDRFLTEYPCDIITCDNCCHCARFAERAVTIVDGDAVAEAIRRVQDELSVFLEYTRSQS